MSKYTRKFRVEVEGGEPIWVAALTCGQAEEFLEEQELALKEEDSTKRVARLEKNTYQFIVNALNNADEPGAELWSTELVKARLDKQQIDAILAVAMVRSGLSRPNQPAPETKV